MTWLFVSSTPSAEMMTPEPRPVCGVRRGWRGPNGKPNSEFCPRSARAGALLAVMLTTAGASARAAAAKPVRTAEAAGAAGGAEWSAEVLWDDAPYGVGYVVALWTPPRGAS